MLRSADDRPFSPPPTSLVQNRHFLPNQHQARQLDLRSTLVSLLKGHWGPGQECASLPRVVPEPSYPNQEGIARIVCPMETMQSRSTQLRDQTLQRGRSGSSAQEKRVWAWSCQHAPLRGQEPCTFPMRLSQRRFRGDCC